MLEFQERRKLKRILYSKPAIAALAAVAVFLVFQVWGVWQKEQASAKVRADRERALNELLLREQELSEELEHLSTPQGIEEEIRTRFDVARKGEHVIVLLDPQPAASQESGQRSGFWEKFRNFFSF